MKEPVEITPPQAAIRAALRYDLERLRSGHSYKCEGQFLNTGAPGSITLEALGGGFVDRVSAFHGRRIRCDAELLFGFLFAVALRGPFTITEHQ